jgi:hypothetical protein
MALSKIFKKTSTPDELPDLAIDELKRDLKKEFSEKQEEKAEEKTPKPEEKKEEIPKSEEIPLEEETEQDKINQDEKEKVEEIIAETESKEEEKPKEKISIDKVNLEKSFFNPLLAELKKENFDPAKINAWYQQRFSEKGAIEEMKKYWEKQKDEFITETIEKEFRERINERMIYLQKLEAEWQEMYINLVKKEEEMKKEEKSIRKIIKEFSEVIKRKGNLKKEHKSK